VEIREDSESCNGDGGESGGVEEEDY